MSIFDMIIIALSPLKIFMIPSVSVLERCGALILFYSCQTREMVFVLGPSLR